jgi:hypothetical protein
VVGRALPSCVRFERALNEPTERDQGKTILVLLVVAEDLRFLIDMLILETTASAALIGRE